MKDSRTSVLIVVQNLPVPFDRRVWLEATTLTQAGYRVSVICPQAKGYDTAFETIEGIDIYRYRLPVDADGALGFAAEFLWCFAATSRLALRVLRRSGIDILHVCNPPEIYFPLGWLARLSGRKFVFDHHDLSPEMYRAKFGDRYPSVLEKALLWLERRTFKAADVVVTTNNSHKAIAERRGGVASDDIFVVRSGPDLSRLEVRDAEPDWRAGRDHLIVYLGEICKQDGVDHLVRAVRTIRDEFGRSDVHCVLVGGGPYQPEIKAYAEELGVSDFCTFTGRVSDDDLCRVLSSADVGVDPDPKNDWSDKSTMNKIMEYMYFSLPVAAYDLAETRVSAGDAALYAEANDERSLAEAILTLVDDPERRSKMGAKGRKRIIDQLSWEHSVEHLLAAYDRAAEK